MATVAHVVLNLHVGGLERVVVNLVKGFRNTRYDCVVCCLEDDGPFASEIRSVGVDVKVFGKRKGVDWYCIWQMAQYFRQRHVAIVHTHNVASHLHGASAAKLAGALSVHTKHGRDYPDSKKKVLLNRILSLATCQIITVSDDARDVVTRVEKVDSRKVTRIWNGIDTESYRPSASPVEDPILGTVARLSPEKDQKTLLLAFQLVLRKMPNARLLLVGDGPDALGLRELSRRLGIADRVDFLGARADVPELLRTFSIFTLTSTTEGISMTLLEAMATRLPVVATDVGGNREVLAPPEYGVIVPAGNVEALAVTYLDLLANPRLRLALGENARSRVEEHFSLRGMVDGYMSVYDGLTNCY